MFRVSFSELLNHSLRNLNFGSFVINGIFAPTITTFFYLFIFFFTSFCHDIISSSTILCQPGAAVAYVMLCSYGSISHLMNRTSPSIRTVVWTRPADPAIRPHLSNAASHLLNRLKMQTAAFYGLILRMRTSDSFVWRSSRSQRRLDWICPERVALYTRLPTNTFLKEPMCVKHLFLSRSSSRKGA